MPEFWQRLPVKYYLQPLRLEETKNLVAHRMSVAGFDEDREVFTAEALQAIQRFSHGLPRTIVAVCDIALLVGAAYQAQTIGFKEVSKAIHAMSGKGETENLAFLAPEKKDGNSLFRSLISRFRR
jgi:type II secretory pathway predicted ATPase ExeA